MAKNLGKKFEAIIGKAFEDVRGCSVDRIPDQTMKYKDRKNVADFIVYKYPNQYYIECKTVHGNTLPFSNITQFDALYEKSFVIGVCAGVMCWWVDKDVTRWIRIEELAYLKRQGRKSIRYDESIPNFRGKTIPGRKKRVYFEYFMELFFR